MLSHLSLGIRDLDRSVVFYDAVITALGAVRVWRSDKAAGYGHAGGEDQLAIFRAEDAAAAGGGTHVALSAASSAAVDAFHAAALAHGGTSEGGPGLRPRYGAGYYAAFVRDPDGHKLEAVCHLGVTR